MFCAGRGRRAILKHGPDVPTSASIHEKAFNAYLDAETDVGERPEIILDERSSDTRTNLFEISRIIETRGWVHVGILTSSFHLPRTMMLCWNYVPQMLNRVSFLTAEMIATDEHGGPSDEELHDIYRSPQYNTRMAYELQGIVDIMRGNYPTNPFFQPE